ncbi:MAG: ACT domain-containing protein [Eubacterium sp.]|nr:ACT domain-containing protein [Eubacterium sp.]
MSVKQISVFLENKPGQLNQMTNVLSEHDIDMKALSLAETTDFGIARFIVDDVLETVTVLNQEGYISRLTPVVAVEIPDEPGALNRVLQVFTDNEINLEYMYAILSSEGQKAYMIFKVHDDAKASAALTAAGIQVLNQEDLSEL